MQEGKGIFKWNDGRVYEGDFSRGKIHGKGKYDGYNIIFEGYFENNLFHGEGII